MYILRCSRNSDGRVAHVLSVDTAASRSNNTDEMTNGQ